MKKILLSIVFVTAYLFLQATTFTVDLTTEGGAFPNNTRSFDPCGVPNDPNKFNGTFVEGLQQLNAGNVDTINFTVTNFSTVGHFGGSGVRVCGSNGVIIGNGVNLTQDAWRPLTIVGNVNTIEGINLGAGVIVTGSDNNISGGTSSGDVNVSGVDNDVILTGGNQGRITIGGSDNTVSGMNATNLTFSGSSNTLSNGSFSNTGSFNMTGTQNLFEDLIVNTGNGIIQVDGNSNTFRGCTFSRNTYVNDGPLDIRSDFNTIDDCIFRGNVWLGKISPRDETNDNTITGSTFEGHLEIEGSRNTISDTYVEDNFILGNFAPILANDNEVTNVTVGNASDLNSTSRILFIGNNNILDNVNLTGTSVIFATGSNNTYRNSSVFVVEDPNTESPGLAGVTSISGVELTTGADDNTIDNISVTTNLAIDQVNFPISGIQINENSVNNEILNSTLNGMWNGIHVINSADNDVEGNEVMNNVNMGIVLESSDNSNAEGNNAHDNLVNGIHIYGPSASNSIVNNEVHNNQFNGIVIQDETNANSNNSIVNNFVYSQSGGVGIYLYGSSGITVDGNSVGLDRSGAVSGNGTGIKIEGYDEVWGNNASDNNRIGVNGANTVVASSNHGIHLVGKTSTRRTTRTQIVNNNIGNYTGSNANYENGEHGLLIDDFAQNNVIGTTTSGNTISNKTNAFAAIAVQGTNSTGNTIQGNVTSCNAAKGIELINDGNQNYGRFTSETVTSGQLTFNTAYSPTGNLIGGRAPEVGAIIDIYIANACDGTCQSGSSVNPQGALWVGTVTAIANPNGDPWAVWEATISNYPGLLYDNAVVTASSPSSSVKNTSEFAVCFSDQSCDPPVQADLVSSNVDFCEDDMVVLTVTSDVTTDVQYSWFRGTTKIKTSSFDTLNVDESGTYSVIVENVDEPTVCFLQSNDVTVTKRNFPVPTGSIIGPDSVCKGDLNVVYTFDQNTFDTYTWGAPVNAIKGASSTNTIPLSFTNSNAGNASIGIIVGQNYGTIICESQIPVEKQIEVIDLNVSPVVDGERSPECNTGGHVYTIQNLSDFDSKHSFEWVVPNGAVITDASVRGQITVTMSDNSGIVSARAISTNGCESGTSPIAITVIGCGIKADFAITDTVCSGNTISLGNLSSFGLGATQFDTVIVVITPTITDPNTFAIPDDTIIRTNVGLNDLYDISFSVDKDAEFDIYMYVRDDLGATAEVTKNQIITVLANPTAPLFATYGNCQGDTAIFVVDPIMPNTTYSWESSTPILDETDDHDSIRVINPASSYTVRLTASYLDRCEASNQRTVSVTPGFTSVSFDIDQFVCDELHSDPTPIRTFSSRDTASYIDYTWEMLDNDGNTLSPVGVDNNYFVEYQFPEADSSVEYYTLTVKVENANSQCTSFNDSLSWTITVDSSELYDFEILSDIVCVGDTKTYYGKYLDEFLPDSLGASYTWVLNGDTLYWDTLVSNNNQDTLIYVDTSIDSVFVDDVQPTDTLILLARPSACYKPIPQINYRDTLGLPTVKRPGADLWVSESEDRVVVGNSTNFILNLNDLSEVELEDRFEREGTLPEIFNTYKFTLSRSIDEKTIDGEDSVEFITVLQNPTGFSPDPNYTAYDFLPNQDTTEYILSVYNGYCFDYDTVYVVIDFNIYIPNVFTPNGDGVYDEWAIKNIDQFPNNKVTVYNRWGNVVYEESGYDNEDVIWEGEQNGEKLPFGTYYYIVDLGNGADPFSGYVSIIK